jgi:hypothetical protein
MGLDPEGEDDKGVEGRGTWQITEGIERYR